MIYRSISPHETAGVKIVFKTDPQKYGVGYGLDVAHLNKNQCRAVVNTAINFRIT